MRGLEQGLHVKANILQRRTEEHRSGAETILGTQDGAERHPTTAPKPLTCGRSTARHGARAGHDAVHARLGITARGSNQRHPLAPHIMAAGGA